jgi:hypothetical protein
MEPRHEKSVTPDSTPERQIRKPRFQIVKLEERIAPCHSGIHARTHVCHFSNRQTCNCYP